MNKVSSVIRQVYWEIVMEILSAILLYIQAKEIWLFIIDYIFK